MKLLLKKKDIVNLSNYNFVNIEDIFSQEIYVCLINHEKLLELSFEMLLLVIALFSNILK